MNNMLKILSLFVIAVLLTAYTCCNKTTESIIYKKDDNIVKKDNNIVEIEGVGCEAEVHAIYKDGHKYIVVISGDGIAICLAAEELIAIATLKSDTTK